MAASRLRIAVALLAGTVVVDVHCDLTYQIEHYIGSGYGEVQGRLRHPTYVTLLPTTGELVVADSWNHRLQIFSPSGQLRRVVGSFGMEKGEFWQPHGLASNVWALFVVDSLNHRIQKLNVETMAPLATAGRYGSGPGQLNFPRGVAIHKNFTVFVADSGNNRIVTFAAGTMDYKFSFGSRGTGPGQLSHPEGLVFVEDRRELFVADSGNDRISVFDQNGRFLRAFGVEGDAPGSFLLPVGLAAAHGLLYVGEYYGGRVQVLTFNGEPRQTLNLGAAGRLAGLSVCKRQRSVYAVDEDWAIVHKLSIKYPEPPTPPLPGGRQPPSKRPALAHSSKQKSHVHEKATAATVRPNSTKGRRMSSRHIRELGTVNS